MAMSYSKIRKGLASKTAEDRHAAEQALVKRGKKTEKVQGFLIASQVVQGVIVGGLTVLEIKRQMD